VAKLSRVKIQIKSFLLQHGIAEPHGLTSWSIQAIEKLKTINLTAQLRYCLDTLLIELDFLKEQLKSLEKKLKDLFSRKKYDRKINHPKADSILKA